MSLKVWWMFTHMLSKMSSLVVQLTSIRSLKRPCNKPVNSKLMSRMPTWFYWYLPMVQFMTWKSAKTHWSRPLISQCQSSSLGLEMQISPSWMSLTVMTVSGTHKESNALVILSSLSHSTTSNTHLSVLPLRSLKSFQPNWSSTKRLSSVLPTQFNVLRCQRSYHPFQMKTAWSLIKSMKLKSTRILSTSASSKTSSTSHVNQANVAHYLLATIPMEKLTSTSMAKWVTIQNLSLIDNLWVTKCTWASSIKNQTSI